LGFDLTQGLFSSAGIDVGTRLLLKVFSEMLDSDARAGRPPPGKVLDAGCGVGVIGVCAAAALSGVDGLVVRCQDRDELARFFTLHNAEKNGVPASVLDARAEPLLAGPAGCRWDFIFSNIPAKAGTLVLEDFVSRSVGLLNLGGRVVVVVVQTLADFFRNRIALAGAEILSELAGSGHCVFVYAAGEVPTVGSATGPGPIEAGPGFLSRYPFYVRASVNYVDFDGSDDSVGSGDSTGYLIDTTHGASGFDGPGRAVTVAARLIARLGPEKLVPEGEPPLLVHEPGQGFFPCLLTGFLRDGAGSGKTPPLVLSGRNVLALEASRHNLCRLDGPARVEVVPAVDLRLGGPALLDAAGGNRYAGVFAFPELLPQSSLPKGTDQLATLWDSLAPLLSVGGVFLATFGSSDAERFDRKKPAGFTRLGNLKRDGFRALAYRLAGRIPPV